MQFIIILTEKCNLNCSYCYEQHKGNDFMALEMGDKIVTFINKYINEDKVLDSRSISINFNGGEPLMNYEVLKEQLLLFKGNGIDDFTISTNLVLADKEKLDFLYNQGASLHISLDGPKEAHDLYRVNHAGEGSFDKVYHDIKFIRENYPDWKNSYNITLTPETSKYFYRSFKMLTDLGIRNITTAFCSDYIWDKESLEDFKNNMRKISDDYIMYYEKGEEIYFKFLSDSINNSIYNSKPICGVCADEIAILPSGELLPCGMFVGLKDYKDFVMGTIDSYLKGDKIDFSRSECSIDTAECEPSALLPRCHNTCFAINQRVNNNITKCPDNYCYINQICLLESEYVIEKLFQGQNRQFFEEYKHLNEILVK